MKFSSSIFSSSRVASLLSSVLWLAPAGLAQETLFTVDGAGPDARIGFAVAGAGDLNQDGFADWVVGSPGEGTGLARAFSGMNGGLLHLVQSPVVSDSLGYAVAGAGDVDQDGFPDLLIADPRINLNPLTTTGYTLVVSGQSGIALYSVDSDLSRSFRTIAVSGAGDLNQDGSADFLTGSSASLLGFPAEFTARSGTDGSPLFTVQDQLSISLDLSAVGDVDNDGSLDVALGGASAATVYSATGVLLRTIPVTHPAGNLDHASVGAAGDLDGDGFDDVLVGAPMDATAGVQSGEVRVISGQTGATLLQLSGSAGDGFGRRVAGVADLDGDGGRDFAVSSNGGSTVTGAGAPGGGALSVYSGTTGARVFRVSDELIGTGYGWSMDAAGDVDGDGLEDLVVGAPTADPNGADSGRAIVVSGGCPGVAAYGVASPGSGGFSPALETSGGTPWIGNDSFMLEVSGGLGGAPAALFVGAQAGNLAAPWGTFLIAPASLAVRLDFTLSGPTGVAGVGALALAAPIPLDPSLKGISAFLQVLVADPGSSGGIAHTAGLEVEICQ